MESRPPVQHIEHETLNSLHTPTLLRELDYQETFGMVKKSSFPGFQAIHFVEQLLLCVGLFAEILFAEIHFDSYPPLILGVAHLLLLCVELFAEIHFDSYPPLILGGVHQLLLCVELFAEIQFAEIHSDFCHPLILGGVHQLLLYVELFAEIQCVEIQLDFCLLFVPGLVYSLLLFGRMFDGTHFALARLFVWEPSRGLQGNGQHRFLLQGSPFWI